MKARKARAKKPAKKPAGRSPEGVAASYLALFEELTRKVPRVAVSIGSFRFPKGGVAKWLARKDVASTIEQLAEDVANGERFFDVRIEGDSVAVVAWDWREDFEHLDGPFVHAIDEAGKVGGKGQLLQVARFDDAGCKWTTWKLAPRTADVDEGETTFESARMQRALAEAAPPFRAWLDAHPDTKRRFKHAGKYGYVDREGTEVIAPKFERAYAFSNGLANVQEGRHARLMRTDGTLLPGTYFLTSYFLRGLAPVAPLQDHYGYADGKGKLVIPAEYLHAEPFHGPLATVELKGWIKRWITPTGKLVGDPIEFTHGFTEDLAWIYSYADKRYRCIDGTGAPAFAASFYAAGAFSGGLAAVIEEEGGKWGYCDRTGRVVIAPRFDEAHAFSEGRAAVKLGKKLQLVDERGKLLGEPFDGTNATMSEGRLAVRIKGRYGFVDRDGAVVVSPKFADAHGYFEGRAYVQVKDRWGHIGLDGRFTVPAELEWTNRYRDGLAPAKQRGLYGFIDLAGSWVVLPRYAAAQPQFTDGLAWVRLP